MTHDYVVTVRYPDRQIVEYPFQAVSAQQAVDAFRAYDIPDAYDIVRVAKIDSDWV